MCDISLQNPLAGQANAALVWLIAPGPPTNGVLFTHPMVSWRVVGNPYLIGQGKVCP